MPAPSPASSSMPSGEKLRIGKSTTARANPGEIRTMVDKSESVRLSECRRRRRGAESGELSAVGSVLVATSVLVAPLPLTAGPEAPQMQ
eukprot:CAMPEP_0178991926 /NCGR_PEP_ID=MMETSP0795-20121207/5814_1 /TAXON_ID=88552 /ORGANISM="Amoebophrya sp., Strain Ameob2" /LENGTH=88 /DNA_ID=CAMNT_0020683719 /DNA_START=698 /DNA_END=964 /DNA_ORIENTATION=+